MAEHPSWLKSISEMVERKIDDFNERSEDHHMEVTCLALTIYHEARGESEYGQRKVAEVVINRSKNPRYPNKICAVMFQNKQFSFIGRKNLTPREQAAWGRAVAMAQDAISKKPSSPYLNFRQGGRGKRIGSHVFF